LSAPAGGFRSHRLLTAEEIDEQLAGGSVTTAIIVDTSAVLASLDESYAEHAAIAVVRRGYTVSARVARSMTAARSSPQAWR
jgi:hypothetical protein